MKSILFTNGGKAGLAEHVPAKLVKQILAGDYMNLAHLLPSQFIASSNDDTFNVAWDKTNQRLAFSNPIKKSTHFPSGIKRFLSIKPFTSELFLTKLYKC